jgi:hypothetical protein
MSAGCGASRIEERAYGGSSLHGDLPDDPSELLVFS